MSWNGVSAGYKNIPSMQPSVCGRDGEMEKERKKVRWRERKKRVIDRVAPGGSIYSM